MKYQKANIENGRIEVTESIEVDQNSLTSDCWLVQIQGLKACANCEFRNTPECGGDFLKSLQ